MTSLVPRRSPPPSGIRAIFDRAAELEASGRRVLRLDVGRPVWKLPPGAAEGLTAALEAGESHYTANRGLPALRSAIAADLRRATGRSFDPDSEVVVTAGAMEAVTACALAFLGPDDEAIVPEPAWSHYAAAFELAGATVVPLALDPATGFVLDPDALAAAVTDRTRMIVVNSPGNPTGAVQPPAVLEAVAALARERNLLVLSDDVYGELAYDGEGGSMARVMGDDPGLLQVGSLSKSDAMTGWRIGWVAAAPPAADVLARVHTYLTTCAVSLTQHGAAAGLTHPQRAAYLDELRAAFAERRAVWTAALGAMPGVSLPVEPGGAIYLFPRIEHRGMSGRELCLHLLEEHDLALVPGDVFGAGFEAHVRISFGGDPATQREAADRLADLLAR